MTRVFRLTDSWIRRIVVDVLSRPGAQGHRLTKMGERWGSPECPTPGHSCAQLKHDVKLLEQEVPSRALLRGFSRDPHEAGPGAAAPNRRAMNTRAMRVTTPRGGGNSVSRYAKRSVESHLFVLSASRVGVLRGRGGHGPLSK